MRSRPNPHRSSTRGATLPSCSLFSYTYELPNRLSDEDSRPERAQRVEGSHREIHATHTRASVISTTYALPNLQFLCFDDDATVGWVAGGTSFLAVSQGELAFFCFAFANFAPVFSTTSRMLLPQPFYFHAFALLPGGGGMGPPSVHRTVRSVTQQIPERNVPSCARISGFGFSKVAGQP